MESNLNDLIGKRARVTDGKLYIDNKLVSYETDEGFHGSGYAEAEIDLKDFDEGLITDLSYTRHLDTCSSILTISIYHEQQTMANLCIEAGSVYSAKYGAMSILYLDEEELERVEW